MGRLGQLAGFDALERGSESFGGPAQDVALLLVGGSLHFGEPFERELERPTQLVHLEDFGGGRDAGQRVDMSYEGFIGCLGRFLVEVAAQGREPFARFLAEGVEHGARDAAISEDVLGRFGRGHGFGRKGGVWALEGAQAFGFGYERGDRFWGFESAGGNRLHPVGEKVMCLPE